MGRSDRSSLMHHDGTAVYLSTVSGWRRLLGWTGWTCFLSSVPISPFEALRFFLLRRGFGQASLSLSSPSSLSPLPRNTRSGWKQTT